MTRVVNLRNENAEVVIDRRSRYGNPFRTSGDWIVWAAVALGYRADAAGRRAAAIALYRAWMTDTEPVRGDYVGDQSEIEYTDGRRVTISRRVEGLAMLAATGSPKRPKVPDRPALEPLRGKTLGCWCKPLACHGDVIVELLGEAA